MVEKWRGGYDGVVFAVFPARIQSEQSELLSKPSVHSAFQELRSQNFCIHCCDQGVIVVAF